MNVGHRTLNVEHRIMYSAIYNKDKATGGASAFHIRRSMLGVGRSMFKWLHLKFHLNLHNTLKFM